MELWGLRGYRGLVSGRVTVVVLPCPCRCWNLVRTAVYAVYLHSSCSGWQHSEGRGKRRKIDFGLLALNRYESVEKNIFIICIFFFFVLSPFVYVVLKTSFCV